MAYDNSLVRTVLGDFVGVSVRATVCFLAIVTLFALDIVSAQENEVVEISRLGETPRLHLFLLLGQSNMAGRGRVDGEDPPHDRIYSLDRDLNWRIASDPLHFDKPKMVGVGLGRSFAADYAREHPGAFVGLVPCAVGGSAIESWTPGGFHEQTKSHPYDDAMRRAKHALKSGELKGILWHQGESDSNQVRAPQYQDRLAELIDRLSRELDARDAPWVIGQMGYFEKRPWDEFRRKVDSIHRGYPDLDRRVGFASAYELTDKGDRTHFDTASYRELGHRYYDAWKRIVSPSQLSFETKLDTAHAGFDGQFCWVHARVGIIPSVSDAKTHAVMTTQPLELSGSDVFYAHSGTMAKIDSESWTPLKRQSAFQRESIDGKQVTVCDLTPKWHQATQTLLGIGQTVWYENNRVMHVRPRATGYSVFDRATAQWKPWKRLKMPDEPRFSNAGAGSVQRFDLADGSILLPIYFKKPEQRQYSTTVCLCDFDGETLVYREHGSELTVNNKRGLYEPSITKFKNGFFLTMRNDDRGYVSHSEDGLEFSDPIEWKFDDGTALGNYNTQQHWVTHSDGLFLVYTRRGANNDHVFRHRAPLFMARVDPEKLCVVRATEKVIVPERGARLGNFGVVDVSPNETWVTVTEWMQPIGVEKHGSDNSIFVLKIRWDRPNRYFGY